MMAPLPETADELCEIARSTGADLERDIHLGAALTEPKLKALSKSGALADYKVISFSTHGAMAGELFKGKEPGLIMTPPEEASEEDDGYLTASEITELKLDADWVILSACNTAAGAGEKCRGLVGFGACVLLCRHAGVTRFALVGVFESFRRPDYEDL
jgi:CHAT domain-containing protein